MALADTIQPAKAGAHDCRDIVALSQAIRKSRTTARDALETCLARIDAENGAVNAIVCLDAKNARKTADARDRAARVGHWAGPLHGIPITIKECFDWAGRPTTWGDPRRAARNAACDAVVVRRLIEAGAVIIGKTNIPAYLGDWETANPLFGGTRNPHDLERSAGGSSGGSAAAVASGMSYADIGSDQGGSIRLPAHYCGIVGLKPTWGLVPLRGHSPLGEIREPDIGVAGPLTRSARDAALLLRLLSDPIDTGGAWKLELPVAEQRPFRNLRVAAIIDDDHCPIDSEYRAKLLAFAEALGQAGASVDMDARPQVDFVRHTELMNLLVRVETSTKAPLRAGPKARPASKPARSNDERDVSAARYAALAATGEEIGHREWLELHEERLRINEKWERFYADYDVLLCPAGASAAPAFREFDEVSARTIPVNGEERPVLEQHFWFGLASLPGLPAITVPIGRIACGLPVGTQFIARRYADLTLCALAQSVADVIVPKM